MVAPTDSLIVNERKPFMGIRLSRKTLIPVPTTVSDDETCEVIMAWQQQDSSSYACQDYLYTRADTEDNNDDEVDTDCREKMIEWCYRVCDCGIFPCDREMVAIAISYLDRYMMHLRIKKESSSISTTTNCCDRPTFKLAAVTSFYLATKIMSNMQMRIESLVDLGRGSFDGEDILLMELQILQVLEWKMNPPTVQSFIRQFWSLLPSSIRRNDSIYHRSIYFAELSVYEYEFVTDDRCIMAVACLLNAIQSRSLDIEDSIDVTTKELEILSDFVVMSKDTMQQEASFRRIQAQLRHLYNCSAQFSEDMKQTENVVVPKYSPHHSRIAVVDDDDATVSSSLSSCRQSPVSVHDKNA